MNPPGKAIKRGVTEAHLPPVVKIQKERAQKATESSTVPVFRILGLLLLALGILSLGAGLLGLANGASSFLALYGGIGCLFWSALMYAIAEVLTRLAEISAAVRKQAERPPG